jgi:FkbM family methyltransferase
MFTTIRGLIYWLLAQSTFAFFCGCLLPRRVPTLGGTFETSANCDPRLKSALFFGLYEYAERYLVRKYLPGSLNCVELGSGIGVVSACILRKLSPNANLDLVEALPENARLLEQNLLRGNRCQWRLHQKAISYRSKTVWFNPGGDHITGRIGDQEGNPSGGMEIPAVEIEDLPGCQIEYSLVMDIEGEEHDLIQHTPLSNCRCLIVELHGDEQLLQSFITAAKTKGLKLIERKHFVFAFMRN